MAVPMKNLLPNKSGVMKVPYFAMPISYGLNSTQSADSDIIISLTDAYNSPQKYDNGLKLVL